MPTPISHSVLRVTRPPYQRILYIRKPDQVTSPAPAPSSAFAGMGATKPGFGFGTGAAGQQPSTSSFSLGAPSISSLGSAGPTAARGTPGGGVATGGFSFLSNAPATTPAALSKPSEKKLVPPQSTAVVPQPVGSSATQGTSSSTAVGTGWQGGAFGEGKNAARGRRLNKRFSSWISHQLDEDADSFLDSGLRDYVAFAAEIRERVNLVKADPVLTTAFRHPSVSAETTPKAAETSTSTISQASLEEPPPTVEASAPAPPAAVKPAPGFSFSAPSTLPAAPSGPQFSFALPSAATSTSVSGGATNVAPSVTSPLGGFKFNSGGLGAVGASPGAFNGERYCSLELLSAPFTREVCSMSARHKLLITVRKQEANFLSNHS